MIEFSIENQETKEPVQELKLGLRLEAGQIKLVAVNKRGGVDWYILRISSDGILFRNDYLSRGIGLQLDGRQRIKEQPNG